MISVYTKHIKNAFETQATFFQIKVSEGTPRKCEEFVCRLTCSGVGGGAPFDITKEEQHEDRFAALLSWLRTLTIKAALWQRDCQHCHRQAK